MRSIASVSSCTVSTSIGKNQSNAMFRLNRTQNLWNHKGREGLGLAASNKDFQTFDCLDGSAQQWLKKEAILWTLDPDFCISYLFWTNLTFSHLRSRISFGFQIIFGNISGFYNHHMSTIWNGLVRKLPHHWYFQHIFNCTCFIQFAG